MDAWDIAAIVAGYLLGSVDFGVIVPRLLGVDIYGTGSGNPGATNVLRTMGRKEAALVLLGDLAKGVGAAALGSWAGGPVIGFAAGLAAVVGHCFPVWHRFKGGKGVAAAGGMVGLAGAVGAAGPARGLRGWWWPSPARPRSARCSPPWGWCRPWPSSGTGAGRWAWRGRRRP